jgi:RHS repeat-associated protein
MSRRCWESYARKGEAGGTDVGYGDGLGSVSEALSSSGTVTAAQLYGPYGGTRYSSGTMPTAKGFSGQRADASTSGLDYYGARYYDPLLGQFASADTQSA